MISMLWRRCNSSGPRLIANCDNWIRILRRHRKAFFSKQFDVLAHAPSCPIKTILNGMADPGESFQTWRIKSKEGWIVSRFDHQRIGKLNHVHRPMAVQYRPPSEWHAEFQSELASRHGNPLEPGLANRPFHSNGASPSRESP